MEKEVSSLLGRKVRTAHPGRRTADAQSAASSASLLLPTEAAGGSLAPARPGVTLVEVLVACVMVGMLLMVASAKYTDWRDKANVTKAVADIVNIDAAITAYGNTHNALPVSLNQLGTVPLDPWGRPYQFYDFSVGGDQPRKDRFLNPINTSYDLYSMGKDGRTQRALTARFSRDDIVRAQDGAFIGVASDF